MATVLAVQRWLISIACLRPRPAPRSRPQAPESASVVPPVPEWPTIAVATVWEPAATPERFAVARSRAMTSPARGLRQMLLDKVTCSYLGPALDHSIVTFVSGQLHLVPDAEIGAATRPAAAPTRRHQPSISADGRSARLKSDVSKIRMDELSVEIGIRECTGVQPRQVRRCGDHQCLG